MTAPSGQLLNANRSTGLWSAFSVASATANLATTPVLAARAGSTDLTVGGRRPDGSLYLANSASMSTITTDKSPATTPLTAYTAQALGLSWVTPVSTTTPQLAMIAADGYGLTITRPFTTALDIVPGSSWKFGSYAYADPNSPLLATKAQGMSAVSISPNREDVFTRSPTSGALLHTVWNGASWSAWESLGGTIAGNSEISAVAGTAGSTCSPGTRASRSCREAGRPAAAGPPG